MNAIAEKNDNVDDLTLKELRKKCRNLIYNRKRSYRKYKELKHEFIKIWNIMRKVDPFTQTFELRNAFLMIFYILKYSNGMKIFGIQEFEKFINLDAIPEDFKESLINKALEGKK
jgi:hypothetical protein